MTDCIVMIPARRGSKGIPRKNLHPVAGRPLAAWTIHQALAAAVGPVAVVTDDPGVSALADQFGVTVYEEPVELAADAVSMESVMSWFLGQCRERAGSLPDWLMLLQPTSPLRLSEHIKGAWSLAQSGRFDSVFSAVPSAHCSWRFDGKKWMPEWPQAKPLMRLTRQEAGPQITENGAIYLFRTERFLLEGTRYCGDHWPYLMDIWTAMEIDHPHELALVEKDMRARMQLGSDGVRT